MFTMDCATAFLAGILFMDVFFIAVVLAGKEEREEVE